MATLLLSAILGASHVVAGGDETQATGAAGGLYPPGTVLDAAVTFAERLREKVAEHTFTYSGGTLRRTMSCGVGMPAACDHCAT